MSLIPCNAAAPLLAELRDRLLLYEDVDASSSSRAERLRFEMDEKTEEGGRTGVEGGMASLSLESGSLFTGGGGGAMFPVVGVVLLPGATSEEFEIAPRV